jgi:hypothetical protein
VSDSSEERIMPFIRAAAHVIPEPPAPAVAAAPAPAGRPFGKKEHEYLFPGQPCYYCGGVAESVDHKIPRSKGGQRGANLVPACHRCNQMKGDLTVEQFTQRMKLILWVLESKDKSKKVIQAGESKTVLQCPLAA